MGTDSQGSPVSRNSPITILYLLGSVGMFIGGIVLWNNEHEILAAIVMLLAVSGGASLVFGSGEAQCPACKKKMIFTEEIDCCSYCGMYSRIHHGYAKAVRRSFIAEDPTFVIKLDHLKRLGEWRWPLPQQCCVCGEQATRSKPLEINVLMDEHLLGAVKDIKRYQWSIPHCDEHEDGIEWDSHDEIKFRSYNYWFEFRSLNAK